MRNSEVVMKETKPPQCLANKIHMDRIITSLEGPSHYVELTADTLAGCGPFLQRLLHAAQDTHTADRLDDIFQKVAAHFTACANIAPNNNINIKEFIFHIAARASSVIMKEESLSSSLLLSGGDVHMSISRTSQLVWSRVGQLVIQLVRDSTNTKHIGIIKNVNSSECSRRNSTSLSHSNLTGHNTTNKTTESNISYDRPINIRASPLLLQRIPWEIECGDEKEKPIEEETPAMVSSFTVLWGSIFSFLQLLAKGSTEKKSEEEEEEPQQLKQLIQEGQHPLGSILADCVVNMMEKNRSLLWEAHEMNQHGAAAEVLCVAANNFAWLLQQCKYLPMANALEIKEVLMQCTTDVLEDIVNGYSTELHYIFSLYLFPPRDMGQRQHVTPRLLTGRLAAIRGICNSLAHVLPRSEVKSLLLERLLLPLTERLLDTKEHHHVIDKSSGNYQRSNRNYTLSDDDPAEGFQQQPSIDGSPTTLAQRVKEMLDMLSSDSAFGRNICEQSSSYCTISRLLPVMTS
ncbi:hypothetical protein LSM04_009258 [Trypanosoma melophagium]|uniref:uncharacterized protein n=1 Tax=Trypanosoma melophagium TaxID=715481 RepID=UPI00351A65B9|nr:hypothetical protein LSM04_009258 [Trypanosoma melophagium]